MTPDRAPIPFEDNETTCRHNKPLDAVCDACWDDAERYVRSMREFVEKNTAGRTSC